MVVDNIILEAKIQALYDKMALHRKEVNDISTIIKNLEAICEKVDPVDNTKRIAVDDSSLDAKMTVARRQSIYDKQMSDADTFLA
jgi:hypothetical protein